MPLSEHEQRLLEQIERALYAEDPKFAAQVRTTDLRSHTRRRVRRAVLVLVLGFILMVAGIPLEQPAVSIVGFLVMLVALVLGLTGFRRPGSTRTDTPGAPPSRGGSRGGKGRPPRSGFKDRMDERWQKRWDERDR